MQKHPFLFFIACALGLTFLMSFVMTMAADKYVFGQFKTFREETVAAFEKDGLSSTKARELVEKVERPLVKLALLSTVGVALSALATGCATIVLASWYFRRLFRNASAAGH